MAYVNVILILLALLFVKHWYIDFVNQNNVEVASKGIYGDFHGIMHSAKQGAGTALAVAVIVGVPYLLFAIVCGLIDFVLHYHIDWAKMNYGNRDIKTPQFWNHLGLDQLAHYLTYLMIAKLVVS